MNAHIILDIVALGTVAAAIYSRFTVVITKDPDMPGLKQQIAKLEAQQVDTASLTAALGGVSQRIAAVEHDLDNNDPDPAAQQDGVATEQVQG